VVGNLERNPRAARWSVVCFDGESMPIRKAAVDLVFCSEVLEHVHHPDMFLAELRRVLRSGGDLFLTTPNMAAWHNRILLPLGYPPANYTAYPHKRLGAPSFIQGLDAEVQDHPRVFTRAALLEALGLHDLTIVNDSAISYAVPGRPLFRMRRALDPLIPKTWKEDLVVWARAGSTKEEGRAP
jgi:SAM-dependent methyltransferase